MPATYAPGPRCNAPKYTTAFGACQALNTRYLARTATQPQHVGGLPVDIPWDELGTGWVLPGGNGALPAYWAESSRARCRVAVERSPAAPGDSVDTSSRAAAPSLCGGSPRD